LGGGRYGAGGLRRAGVQRQSIEVHLGSFEPSLRLGEGLRLPSLGAFRRPLRARRNRSFFSGSRRSGRRRWHFTGSRGRAGGQRQSYAGVAPSFPERCHRCSFTQTHEPINRVHGRRRKERNQPSATM
jgi:hypothetical protein